MAASQRVLLCLTLTLALLRPALGWGHDGHLYVCVIAQGLLSDDASAAVQELLPAWASGYMPTVCSWPDVIGHTNPAWRWSLPLHYIDTPDGACNYDFSRDCRLKCVAAAILNYTGQLDDFARSTLHTSTLSSPSGTPLPESFPVAPSALASLPSRVASQGPRLSQLAVNSKTAEAALGPSVAAALRTLFGNPDPEGQDPSEAAVEAAAGEVLRFLKKGAEGSADPDPTVIDPTVALMFLVHFVGDIHQPLHVGFTSDYGGNRIKVHWYKKKTNLHEVWDTEIIKHGVWKYYANNPSTFAVGLATKLAQDWAENIPAWVQCATGEVCPNTFAGESIVDACAWAYKDVVTGDVLEDAYFESRFPVVEQQLAKAGVRLAATLNRIFKKPAAAATLAKAA